MSYISKIIFLVIFMFVFIELRAVPSSDIAVARRIEHPQGFHQYRPGMQGIAGHPEARAYARGAEAGNTAGANNSGSTTVVTPETPYAYPPAPPPYSGQ